MKQTKPRYRVVSFVAAMELKMWFDIDCIKYNDMYFLYIPDDKTFLIPRGVIKQDLF